MQATSTAPSGATGPRTPEGKAISSQNATSHGLTSDRTVLAHESQEQYDELLKLLEEEFDPRSAHETFLVYHMADIQWRLDRAQLIENALFELLIEDDKTNSTPEAKMARAMMNRCSDPLNNLQRYISSLERSYDRAHRALLLGRKANKRDAAKAFESTFRAIMEAPPPVARALASENPSRPTENRALRL